MKGKIVLVNLPYTAPLGLGNMVNRYHMGLAYLASSLRKSGYDVEIIDAPLRRISMQRLKAILLEKNPDIIGITVYQGSASSLLELVAWLKEKNIKSHITAGGQLVSLKTKEVMETCLGLDSIIIGEGEYSFVELADCVVQGKSLESVKGVAYRDNKEVIINPPSKLIENLDELPFPADDDLEFVKNKWGMDLLSVVSSRGCYGTCMFCCMPNYYRKIGGKIWRYRSAKNVIDEIELLTKKWSLYYVQFVNDNFLGPGRNGKIHANEIADEIMKRELKIEFSIFARVNDIEVELFRKLKQAGLARVFIGVESVNQRALDFYKKHTTVEQIENAISIFEELDINYEMGFILFDPYVTFDELKKNIAFIKRVFKSKNNISVDIHDYVIVLAGSNLEKKLIEDGLIISTEMGYGYDINFKLYHEEEQKVFEYYVDIFKKYIVPKTRHNTIDPKIGQELVLLKMEILEKLIDLAENNKLNEDNINTYVNEFVIPQIDVVQKMEKEAYLNKVKNSAKNFKKSLE